MRGYYYKGSPGNTNNTDHALRATHRGRTSTLTAAFVLSLFTLAGFPASTYAAEPDPYLKALNAEGGKLESLGKAKKEEEALMRLEATEKKQAKPSQPAKPPTAASTANAKSFEDDLQNSFPGSYALYSLMDTNEKQQVLAEYQKRTAEGAGRYIPVIKKIIAITNAKRSQNQ